MVIRILTLLLCFWASVAWAQVSVVDGVGNQVVLKSPAKRVVTLAPHLTEHLFAIGAGTTIVGTVDYSDFPAEANQIPRVGGYSGWDLERITALKPDLILAWYSGNPNNQLEQLKKLGVPIFFDHAKVLKDIPTVMKKLGVLTGQDANATQLANHFSSQLLQLTNRYQYVKKVRVFYQVWQKPLMTINDQQIISDAIRLCGGVNVFGSAPSLVPTIDEEAVIFKKPELIATSGGEEANVLDRWKKWSVIPAVANHHLEVLPKDILVRLGPRMLAGTESMCQAIERARK